MNTKINWNDKWKKKFSKTTVTTVLQYCKMDEWIPSYCTIIRKWT